MGTCTYRALIAATHVAMGTITSLERHPEIDQRRCNLWHIVEQKSQHDQGRVSVTLVVDSDVLWFPPKSFSASSFSLGSHLDLAE